MGESERLRVWSKERPGIAVSRVDAGGGSTRLLLLPAGCPFSLFEAVLRWSMLFFVSPFACSCSTSLDSSMLSLSVTAPPPPPPYSLLSAAFSISCQMRSEVEVVGVKEREERREFNYSREKKKEEGGRREKGE